MVERIAQLNLIWFLEILTIPDLDHGVRVEGEMNVHLHTIVGTPNTLVRIQGACDRTER